MDGTNWIALASFLLFWIYLGSLLYSKSQFLFYYHQHHILHQEHKQLHSNRLNQALRLFNFPKRNQVPNSNWTNWTNLFQIECLRFTIRYTFQSTNKENIFVVNIRRFDSNQGMTFGVFAFSKFEIWFQNHIWQEVTIQFMMSKLFFWIDHTGFIGHLVKVVLNKDSWYPRSLRQESCVQDQSIHSLWSYHK